MAAPRFAPVLHLFARGLGTLTPCLALACGVEGTIMKADGSPARGLVAVAPAERSAKVRAGHYDIDLGDAACETKIIVSMSAAPDQEVLLRKEGNVQVNFILPSR